MRDFSTLKMVLLILNAKKAQHQNNLFQKIRSLRIFISIKWNSIINLIPSRKYPM